MRVLFDADSMVYGCGFAAQKTLYDWTAFPANNPEGVCEQGIAPDSEALQEVRALLPDDWALEFQPLVEAEPLENALALAKRQCYRVEEDLERKGFDFAKVELFLTGKGNHRDQIATIKPYKGNRLTLVKPVHYKALRRYLRERWGAKVIHGREADDEVAMIACQYNYDPEEVIIVSQDKDLRTVPGLLYNYRRHEYEAITFQDALVNFYRQIITGDAVDNIMGIYRAGEAVALKAIDDHLTEAQMYDTVLELCEASKGKKGCPYADKPAEQVVLEFGQLLHLQRFEGDIWQPPGSRSVFANIAYTQGLCGTSAGKEIASSGQATKP